MSNTHKKKLIVICGPTAVGKTNVAIRLAQHFNTSIISADSRQCFKELNIAVARPSPDELKAATHFFIATHSIQDEVTAVTFEKYALEKLNDIFSKNEYAIVVGGTGLYIKALCQGMDIIPDIAITVRNEIINTYQEKGILWLQEQVKLEDPRYYAQGEIQNPQRLMRALEVMRGSGQSILDFQKAEAVTRDFGIIKIGLELSRQELNERINKRTDEMMQQGLLQEAEQLHLYQHLNALQTVGYRELFAFLNGSSSIENAIEQIKISTRQYAKRQMTWFKKDADVQWFSPNSIDDIVSFINTV